MNKEEIVEHLTQLNIDPQSYCVGGSFAEEQYVIREEYSVWFVYYAERGLCSGVHRFTLEEEACSHFVGLLKSDTTTQLKSRN